MKMNIIDAAEILNIRHDADYLVVKAAYKALANQHHPDHGGNTEHMQKLNAARDYMTTRSKEARATEWNRLHGNGPRPLPDSATQKPAGRSGSGTASNTRYWTPNHTYRPPREPWTAFQNWQSRQKWFIQWPLMAVWWILVITMRLAIIAAACYGIVWMPIDWALQGLEQGLGVLGIFIALFMGAVWAFGVGKMMLIVSVNFLIGGWKGLMDYLEDGPSRKPFKVNGKDVYL